ncbi:SH3 domain-containing protein [Desulfosporosinus sp. FKA]|uniref:SH3 domain-containing protein n=1 Tax=Desulfosporosinus sp. FKA TaxID=1969834 RepID=UPI000B49FA45|nr:SH3 domain-containing protein [Desulfosporosinus sp. FKA]
MKKTKSIMTVLLTGILLVAFGANAYATTVSSETLTTSTVLSPNYISPNQPGPGYTGPCTVTAQPSIIVRSGPGTNYSSVGSVLYGGVVNVILVNNSGWAEIRMVNNQTGWVSTSYLTK